MLARHRLSIACLLTAGSVRCASRPVELAPPAARGQTESTPVAGQPLAALIEPPPAQANAAAVTGATKDAGAAHSAVATKDAGAANANKDALAADATKDAVAARANKDAVATDTDQQCPNGMVHIHFDHCPKLVRRCLDKEYDKPNHITICNRFATSKPECREPRVTLDFCIDEYEYPNQVGEKPPVMLNFFEATELCGARNKRLCNEQEWVTACEGPGEKPFPYGYVRSNKLCNFDNHWVDPHLSRVYSRDPAVQREELERLDRSVPSGQRVGCVSDYGVHDLTGNVDEWVRADHDRPHERAKFSALKGGAWGHVRNACRPVTTSHAPEFRYYFIGFRCCADTQARSPR